MILLLSVVFLSPWMLTINAQKDSVQTFLQLLRANNFSADIVGSAIIKGEEDCFPYIFDIRDNEAVKSNDYKDLCSELTKATEQHHILKRGAGFKRILDFAKQHKNKIIAGLKVAGASVALAAAKDLGKAAYEAVVDKLNAEESQEEALALIFTINRVRGYFRRKLLQEVKVGKAPKWAEEANIEVIPTRCDEIEVEVKICRHRSYGTLINVLSNGYFTDEGYFTEDGKEYRYIDLAPYHFINEHGQVSPVVNCRKCAVGDCSECELDTTSECNLLDYGICNVIGIPVTDVFLFGREMATGHLVATNQRTMTLYNGTNVDRYVMMSPESILKVELLKSESLKIGKAIIMGTSNSHDIMTATPQILKQTRKHKRYLDSAGNRRSISTFDLKQLREVVETTTATEEINRIVIERPTFWEFFKRRITTELVVLAALAIVLVFALILSTKCVRRRVVALCCAKKDKSFFGNISVVSEPATEKSSLKSACSVSISEYEVLLHNQKTADVKVHL